MKKVTFAPKLRENGISSTSEESGWINSTVAEDHWHKIDGTAETASDSGANIHVISRALAEEKRWEIYEEANGYNIQFGKKGAITRVSHYIQGAGLIQKVAVVDDAHTNLISTSLLIQDSKEKDVTVIYSDKKVQVVEVM
jgi:hypothetical protein